MRPGASPGLLAACCILSSGCFHYRTLRSPAPVGSVVHVLLTPHGQDLVFGSTGVGTASVTGEVMAVADSGLLLNVVLHMARTRPMRTQLGQVALPPFAVRAVQTRRLDILGTGIVVAGFVFALDQLIIKKLWEPRFTAP